jgi:hypothetical protein
VYTHKHTYIHTKKHTLNGTNRPNLPTIGIHGSPVFLEKTARALTTDTGKK